MSSFSPATTPRGRIVSLDVLRAVAVILVLGHHVPSAWREAVAWKPAVRGLEIWARGGWVGVDLFFVLSGFLVAGLIFREKRLHGDVRIGRFLVRRGLKIYPAFYVMLAVTLVFGLAPFTWPRFLGEVFFLQNVVGYLWPHTWTLAVEEHFYFLLALWTWVRLRTAGDRADPFAVLPKTVLWVALACLALRTANALWLDFLPETHLTRTGLRIDSLLFGVLLAYAFHRDRERFLAAVGRRSRPLLAAGLLFLALPFGIEIADSFFLQTVGLSLLYLGGGMVLAALLAAWRSPGPVARGLAWWGGFSYSVYLWHFPLLRLLERALERADWAVTTPGAAVAAIALYLSTVSALGVVFAKLVEMPVLALRERYFPSRTQGPEGDESPAQRTTNAPAAEK